MSHRGTEEPLEGARSRRGARPPTSPAGKFPPQTGMAAACRGRRVWESGARLGGGPHGALSQPPTGRWPVPGAGGGVGRGGSSAWRGQGRCWVGPSRAEGAGWASLHGFCPPPGHPSACSARPPGGEGGPDRPDRAARGGPGSRQLSEPKGVPDTGPAAPSAEQASPGQGCPPQLAAATVGCEPALPLGDTHGCKSPGESRRWVVLCRGLWSVVGGESWSSPFCSCPQAIWRGPLPLWPQLRVAACSAHGGDSATRLMERQEVEWLWWLQLPTSSIFSRSWGWPAGSGTGAARPSPGPAGHLRLGPSGWELVMRAWPRACGLRPAQPQDSGEGSGSGQEQLVTMPCHRTGSGRSARARGRPVPVHPSRRGPRGHVGLLGLSLAWAD